MNNQQQRLPLARIFRDSALELFLTFLMLFGVVSIVRWVIGPSPISQMIPEIHAELLIVGVGVAILIAGLIMSPPGRTTGGHMNPAISLAMWRFGVFPGVAVAPYIIGSPVWTGDAVGTDPFPLGVFVSSDGGSHACDVAPTSRPPAPICIDTPIVWRSQ